MNQDKQKSNNFISQSKFLTNYLYFFVGIEHKQQMDFIKRRESDPEYLKNVIQQKNIIIEQEQRKYALLLKQNNQFKTGLGELQNQLMTQQNASKNQSLNLNLAIRQQDTQLEAMKHDKSEYEFKLNMLKLQLKDQQKQHKFNTEKLKLEYEGQKQNLQIKITKLQKNLIALSSHYNVQTSIHDDKVKIIQDSNRDLRGFSNQKQERMIMVQNQQYANEIQYQAKEIQGLLQKNQKLQDEIKSMRSDLQMHKQIQKDLVKRSSLAQTLIKQLNKRLKQVEHKPRQNVSQSGYRSVAPSQQQSRLSSSKISNLKEKQQQQDLSKLRFEYANLKNHSLYLENIQKVYSQKYETLGVIMAQYLENLLYFKEKREKPADQTLERGKQLSLDLASLKKKDIKQWKTEELQTILFLLLNQVKPFLSKSSLINFPQMKNMSISFTQPENKQAISLPKISQNYQKTYEKQASKINSRFKDIPLDISTKILRSNLRQWGTKVNHGANIPNLGKIRNFKSKSIAADIDRSAYM